VDAGDYAAYGMEGAGEFINVGGTFILRMEHIKLNKS